MNIQLPAILAVADRTFEVTCEIDIYPRRNEVTAIYINGCQVDVEQAVLDELSEDIDLLLESAE